MSVTVYQGALPSWAYTYDPGVIASYNNSTPRSPFRMDWGYGDSKFRLQTGMVQQNGTGQIYVFETRWLAPFSVNGYRGPDFYTSWQAIATDTGATSTTSTDPDYVKLVQIYIANSSLSLGTVQSDGSAPCYPVSRTVTTQNDAFPSGSLPLCLVGTHLWSAPAPSPNVGALAPQSGLGMWRPSFPIPGQPNSGDEGTPIHLFVDKRSWAP